MTATTTTALIVSEQLYSSLGKPLCTTVPVVKDGNNLFGFIDSFIADREPLNAPDGWVTGGPFDIQSDVVQWAWANNAAITDTDRQYAYQGRYPEKDPLQRTTQGARPGQAFSIQGETDSNNHSISITPGYLPSELENILPTQLLGESTADLYTQLSCTGAENSLGALGYTHRGLVRDFRGRALAKTVVDDAGNTILTTNLYQMGADYNSEASQPFMDETQLYLPNYYSVQDFAQKVTTQTNVLGQNIAQVSPDAGTQLNFYDVYGRLRFSQTADQAQAGTVIYYLYDALSRMIETGFINMAWDVGNFQTLTSLPDASQLASMVTNALRVWVYDQLGNGVIAFETMGKVNQVTSCNTMLSNSAIVVNAQSQLVTSYRYDALGRCTSYTQILNGGTSYTSSYTYDSLNKVTVLNYPQAGESSNSFGVAYNYNIQASINAIGSSENPSAYASYIYNEFGQIMQENLGSNNLQYLSYTYGNTLGQLTKIKDYCGLITLNMSYTDSNGNYQDGNIQQLSTHLYVSLNPSAPQDGCYNYTYDSFGRLTAAQAKSSAWDLSDAEFDANGNLQTVQIAGQAQSYTYASSGSNQLNMALGNTFAYSESGLTTSIQGTDQLAFNYDQLSVLPNQITTSTDTINIIYDAKNERFQKTVGNTSITYLRGSNAWPLSELTTDSTSKTTSVVNYIYGPKGLIVINDPNTAINYIILKDQVGSTRIVHEDVANVGISNIVAYFNYLPYGELVSDASQIQDLCPIPMRYLYTGQEWDSEIGLYNYHARQYHPALGRFLTPDPAHQFANPYCYVANNPVNGTDPTGKITEEQRPSVMLKGNIESEIEEPNGFFINPVSRTVVRNGDVGNYFTGVANVNTGEIYFAPLQPRNLFDPLLTHYPFPAEGIEYGGGRRLTAPINHFFDSRGSSHQQLTELVNGNRAADEEMFGNYVGFSLRKDANGYSIPSFTSRTLNDENKFESNNILDRNEGKMSEYWADQLNRTIDIQLNNNPFDNQAQQPAGVAVNDVEDVADALV